MVAKYLGVDCLQVSESDAVSKMEKLLESQGVVQQLKSKFDKTPKEREAFFRMVKGV